MVENKVESKKGKWYVIHTFTGYEEKVKTNLERKIRSLGVENKIFQILVPIENEIELHETQKKVVRRKIFPGYLLVNMDMDDETWLIVRNTPGVTGFVGIGGKPTSIPEDELDTIMRRIKWEDIHYRTSIQVGDVVRIKYGPFEDFAGTVEEIIPERKKVKVAVSIFGRETPLELRIDQVEKV
jgi:transcriptional antiterminator NusG